MNTMRQEPWTVERFLAWEDKQEGKHEFDGVRIIPMTGGSRAHQWIVFNIMRLLFERLDRNVFDMIAEMRVDLGSKVRYPDIAVCAGRTPGRLRTLHDAVAVFEVVSEETAITDRIEKRREYARLPSIKNYIILEQDRVAVTVLDYAAGNWSDAEVTSGKIKLPAIAVELPLDDIYRDLNL